MAYFIKPSGEKRGSFEGARAIALRNSKVNGGTEYTVWNECEPLVGWLNGRERVLPYSRLNAKFAAELDSIAEGMKKTWKVGNDRVNTTLYCPNGKYRIRCKSSK